MGFCGKIERENFNLPTVEHKTLFLKNLTSIRCGGKAEVYFPKNEEEGTELLRLLKSHEIPYFVLANGTNVLADDKPYLGIILSVKQMKGVEWKEDTVLAAAGESISSLQAEGEKLGVSFAPFMAGVPALVGGAVAMNAGITGYEISSLVKRVFATDGRNNYIFSPEECRFSRKNSLFLQKGLLITKVELFTEHTGENRAKEERMRFLEKRKHLPKGKSMGCVFRNAGAPSGKIIEECGLKGTRIGGAVVSNQHANFILNDKNASFQEILSLIALVKERVKEEKGILLKEEIRYLR